jgi:hypothetical protein
MHLSPSRKAISAALVVAGVVLLGCSGGVNNGPPKGPLGATQYRLSSAAFTLEYIADSTAQHSKYADKVVELKGKLGSIQDGEAGEAYFNLEGPDPAKLDRAICHMASPFPWTQATPGQIVTLRGRGTSRYYVPRLEDCEILAVEGDPAPRFTADEFAARTADPDAIRKKGTSTYLIVTGEFDRHDSISKGVFLKPKTPKPGALVQFSLKTRQRLGVDSWQPGRKVSVIGLDYTNLNAPYAHLLYCLPME